MVGEIEASPRGESGKTSTNDSVVAVYHTHPEADQAVKELQHGGVDLHKLSRLHIAHRRTSRRIANCYKETVVEGIDTAVALRRSLPRAKLFGKMVVGLA